MKNENTQCYFGADSDTSANGSVHQKSQVEMNGKAIIIGNCGDQSGVGNWIRLIKQNEQAVAI